MSSRRYSEDQPRQRRSGTYDEGRPRQHRTRDEGRSAGPPMAYNTQRQRPRPSSQGGFVPPNDSIEYRQRSVDPRSGQRRHSMATERPVDPFGRSSGPGSAHYERTKSHRRHQSQEPQKASRHRQSSSKPTQNVNNDVPGSASIGLNLLSTGMKVAAAGGGKNADGLKAAAVATKFLSLGAGKLEKHPKYAKVRDRVKDGIRSLFGGDNSSKSKGKERRDDERRGRRERYDDDDEYYRRSRR